MGGIFAFIVGTVVIIGQTITLDSYVVLPIKQAVEGTTFAYTASIEETDSTPHLNAFGSKPEIGDIANNCLPFLSTVYIDGKIYTVKDRMNSRYSCDIFDIFMESRERALVYGKRSARVYILGES